ncbi:unnamed protein product [Nesidiocoris tenuis]|uniref:Uncharacterized protein n=1 Tax=Nesidiocoris tenuis TaxID=355587 RepID=A0A6H5GK57_9HEMI|nr:unnamed protein product [Nesidiocoris tenuis]
MEVKNVCLTFSCILNAFSPDQINPLRTRRSEKQPQIKPLHGLYQLLQSGASRRLVNVLLSIVIVFFFFVELAIESRQQQSHQPIRLVLGDQFDTHRQSLPPT